MKKILLIDDDELVTRSIKRLLEKEGYSVETASNAADGISLAAVTNFNLVISDIRMPGENGITAVRKIKEIYSKKNILCGFLLITGYAEEDTPEHAIKLGIDKFIFKPFDNETFLEQVKEEIAALEAKGKSAAISDILRGQNQRGKPGDARGRRRAVITGIGVIAPNGIGKEAYWQGLKEGRNCVDRITFFDSSKYPSKMAAEVHGFRPEDFIPEATELKRMARSSHLAVAAAKLALKDSSLTPEYIQTGMVIIGSSTAGVEYLLPEAYAFERGGLSKVRPYVGIAGFSGSISSEVSRWLGARGMSQTISTGCTSSTDAMGHAKQQIENGLTDLVITGGSDACVSDGILAAFCRIGAVSTRNDTSQKASRPFNKDRDGFVIAEGSWMFILEELEHALNRKARIYCELSGYGATCDAWHMAKPHPSGDFTAAAIQLALLDAEIKPEEVDIFEAYGNSTPINDSYETRIVKKVFGEHSKQLVMPSIKSMLGHPIGAAGSAQVAAAILALTEGFIHPTINYEVPDPECDLDYVPNTGRQGKFNVAICNSLAFGGKNAALALRSVAT